ncbi:hypothetical protein ARMSODRAFT_1087225 [Armillaria solidipes]|uniref:Uncharacterized protein n=1 Tax=Armillaria solidipes TaxID=1076256 RepID=A0A2H3BEV0_9AGAR|nr:hypothetical protein ARMSODRAFT_1087225 [Armillaria solidipes]
MSKIVKKVFAECMYPAAVILDKNPLATFTLLAFTASRSWEWIPFTLVASFIIIYAIHVHSRKMQEEDARKAKFKEVDSIFWKLGSYILDQRFFFEVRAEDVEALQLCLPAIQQRILVTQQKADPLFSAAKQASATSEQLAQIASDLRMLDAQIRGVMRGYSRLETRLQSYSPEQQLEAAKHWVTDINGTSPPVSVDPVDEDTNLGAAERDGE